MGIRFHCPNGHRLNVKAFLAGKRGICPKCGARFEIPLGSESNQTVSATTWTPPANLAIPVLPRAEGEAVDPIADAPDAVWYVRTAAGGEYGPASGDIMRTWLGEGRVTAEAWVWRDGWPDWRQASGLFPHFMAAPIRPPITVHGVAPPAPATVPQPAQSWSPATAAESAESNGLELTAEWSDEIDSDLDLPTADPVLVTSMRHAAARENFRRNMLIMTAVLIASALILVGVAVYLLVVRPSAPAVPVEEKPAAAANNLGSTQPSP